VRTSENVDAVNYLFLSVSRTLLTFTDPSVRLPRQREFPHHPSSASSTVTQSWSVSRRSVLSSWQRPTKHCWCQNTSDRDIKTSAVHVTKHACYRHSCSHGKIWLIFDRVAWKIKSGHLFGTGCMMCCLLIAAATLTVQPQSLPMAFVFYTNTNRHCHCSKSQLETRWQHLNTTFASSFGSSKKPSGNFSAMTSVDVDISVSTAASKKSEYTTSTISTETALHKTQLLPVTEKRNKLH